MRFKFGKARWALAAFAAGLCMSSASLAADAILDQAPEAPFPPQQTNLLWSGAYVGAYGGYNWMNADLSPGQLNGIHGLNGGAFLGYNYQLDNNFVVGLEGMGGISGAEASNGGTRIEQEWDASLRARMGYAFENSMVYGLAGVAGTRATATDATQNDSQTHLGWIVGAGLETFITENITARVEYDFANYGAAEYDLGATNPDIALRDHAIKLGIGLKF